MAYNTCPQCDASCTVWLDKGLAPPTYTTSADRDPPYWQMNGTWSFIASYCKWVGSNGASAICLIPQSYNKPGQTINCTVDPRGLNYGDTRTTWVVGDYVDANNFHAIKTVWTTASFTQPFTASMIKRTAGTDTVLTTFSGVWSAGMTFPYQSLCVVDGAVMGSIGGATNYTSHFIPTSLHGGRLAGMLAGSDDCKFMTFSHKRHLGSSPLDRTCPTCAGLSACGGVCTGGILPMQVKVVIAGLYARDCSACADFNGIYVTKLVYTSQYHCVWEVLLPRTCDPGGGFTDAEFRLRVNASRYSGVDYDVWVYIAPCGFTSGDIWWMTRPWQGPCNTWVDFELPIGTMGFTDCCNSDGTSAFITAL